MLAFPLILGLLTLQPDTLSAQDSSPLTPDPRFGAVETYHDPEAADAAGVGWTRLLFYWSELKKDGPDTWNGYHEPLDRIDREIAGGREVVGLLQDTPAFATDGEPGPGVPRGLYLPVDDPGNLWAGFVREVVSTYQGRIERWIIWNEPDIPLGTFGGQWAGTPADYYQLVKVAWLAAHEVDPAVKIHLAGLTYWHNPDFLREFLEAASADPDAAANGYFFDVATLHIYFRPESTVEIVEATRQTLDDFGLGDKPIWINETNAPPYDDPAQPWDAPEFQVTQEMQASFLLQEFALALSEGVERIAVYKWADQPPPPPGFEPYGLFRADGSARPALAAFEVVTRDYAGATGALALDRFDLREVILPRGDQTTRVLWARRPEGLTVSVPALAESARLIDRSGAETTIYPVDGAYDLSLVGAPCVDVPLCLMGGPPLVLVEQAASDLDQWTEMAASVSGTYAPGEPLPDLLRREPPPASIFSPWQPPGLPIVIVSAGVLVVLGGWAVWQRRRGEDSDRE